MAWRQFINRSVAQIRDETVRVMRASPLDPNLGNNTLPLLSIRSSADLRSWAIGSDSDIGGYSTAKLETYPTTEEGGRSEDAGKGKFCGSLSSKVQPGMKLGGNKVDRSGYAGFRSKARPTLFGTQNWDTSQFTFLKVRVKPSEDQGMRYFVNIQTDGPVRSDLFQHRLWLGQPNVWQDVLVPFSDFTLTNTGTMSEAQIEMYREKVRTIGISVLGPGEGPFELGVESFDCVNLEKGDEEELLAGRERGILGTGGEVAYVMSQRTKG